MFPDLREPLIRPEEEVDVPRGVQFDAAEARTVDEYSKFITFSSCASLKGRRVDLPSSYTTSSRESESELFALHETKR